MKHDAKVRIPMHMQTKTKVEDCFDGSAVYEYVFYETWDEAAAKALNRFGTLEYFADFPRPLFRVTGRGGLFIKGVTGNRQCRVVFPRNNRDALIDEFEDAFLHDPLPANQGTHDG